MVLVSKDSMPAALPPLKLSPLKVAPFKGAQKATASNPLTDFEAILGAFTKRFAHVPVRITYQVSSVLPVLPQMLKSTLFLTLQDVISSIIHHADARHCHINMWTEDDLVVIQIYDHGCNIADFYEHPALYTVRKRTANAGGWVTMCDRGQETNTASGTEITIYQPVNLKN